MDKSICACKGFWFSCSIAPFLHGGIFDYSVLMSLSLYFMCVSNPRMHQKCSVISFGHNSASNSYSLGGVLLNRVFDICDLGVHITSDFKPSLHCS